MTTQGIAAFAGVDRNSNVPRGRRGVHHRPLRTIRNLTRVVALLALSMFALPSHALFIDFESATDTQAITNQFPGAVFSNTVALKAGLSLNEIEFPPRSGSVVVTDSNGPITITFGSDATLFSAFFTYIQRINVEAFDAANVLLINAQTSFTDNTALSGAPGSTPNEQIILSAAGIHSVRITGSLQGGSFTMDDVSATLASEPGKLPEPSSAWLALLALLAALGMTPGLARRRAQVAHL